MRPFFVGASLILTVGAVTAGMALGEARAGEVSARDAAARGGIRFCCTTRGTELLARGGRRIGLPKGVGAWSPDRRLFVYRAHTGRGSDVLGVTDAGGRKRVLVTATRFRGLTGQYVFSFPAWLRDSNRVVYFREIPGQDETEFQLTSIGVAGGAETPIPLPPDVEWGAPMLPSPTANLIALTGSSLVPRQPVGLKLEQAAWLLDPDASTQPRRVVTGIPVAWSPNGRTLAVERSGSLRFVDVATGATEFVLPDRYGVLDWAPDGRRIALTLESRRTERRDIRVIRADGTMMYDPTRTPKRASDETAVWSPDGRRLAFVRNYSVGLDFTGPLNEQPRFRPSRTLVVPASGGRARPLPPLRSRESISDWR